VSGVCMDHSTVRRIGILAREQIMNRVFHAQGFELQQAFGQSLKVRLLFSENASLARCSRLHKSRICVEF